MSAASTRQEVLQWQLDLAARFGARRCRCGAPAVSVHIGSEAVHQAGILLATSKPDDNLCLVHAGLIDSARVA